MKMGAAAAASSKKAGSESPSRFHLREKLGNLQFFSVDSHNRWPVQGWSSGDEASHDLDEEFVAEECARPFTLDHEGGGPCKAGVSRLPCPSEVLAMNRLLCSPSSPSEAGGHRAGRGL